MEEHHQGLRSILLSDLHKLLLPDMDTLPTIPQMDGRNAVEVRFPYLLKMQETIGDLSKAVRQKELGYSAFADNVDRRFTEHIPWKKHSTPQQRALEYANQFPPFEADKAPV